MIIYGVLAYLFLYSGFNTKTRVKVNYEDSSNVYYKVSFLDSEYNNTYNDKYVADMVNYIDINYIYNNLISEYVSGYYRYSVEGFLIAYEDDITDSLWERKYDIVKENTVVIDKNNINNIKIDDNFRIDFRKYRYEILEFIDEYGIDIKGYLRIRINILESLNFEGMNNQYEDNKVITINLPLMDEIFKITVNNIDDKESYYEFTSNKTMNIIFILIGTFCLSLSLTSMVMVIRQFKVLYEKQSKYRKEIKRILSKYDECIVKVNRFYVNKKYNMIYVDSFNELMDVYNNKNKLISFKEMKRDSEAIFVIIDEDNAWIYKLYASDME